MGWNYSSKMRLGIEGANLWKKKAIWKAFFKLGVKKEYAIKVALCSIIEND